MAKISACLVVYNEEAIIERCLDSIYPVADEIIVVHGGECSDRTLEIARRYGARIYIRPFTGTCASYLPLCYEQARFEWILQIDADEFLSENLQKSIRNLVNDDNADAYEFVWPAWDGCKTISKSWPFKRILFRKSQIFFLAIPHFIVGVDGAVKRLPLVLQHQPKYDNYNWESFRTKWLKWARIQARSYLKDLSEITSYHYPASDWPFSVRIRKRIPLLLMPAEFAVTFCKNLAQGGYREGVFGFKFAFMAGLYRVMVNYYIWKFK